jgi:hypothetical protein
VKTIESAIRGGTLRIVEEGAMRINPMTRVPFQQGSVEDLTTPIIQSKKAEEVPTNPKS